MIIPMAVIMPNGVVATLCHVDFERIAFMLVTMSIKHLTIGKILARFY